METLPIEMLGEIIGFADVLEGSHLADFGMIDNEEDTRLAYGYHWIQKACMYATINLKRTNKAFYRAFRIEYDKWKKSREYA